MSTEFSSAKSFPTASIARAAAVALLDAARAAAEGIGIEAAVAVVDATGVLRAFERTDGAPFLTAEVAIDKAWTAASYGVATHAWNAMLAADARASQLAHRPRLVAVGGGLPIYDGGKLVGGIGVSGGDAQQDQDAAEAALRAVGFDATA